MQNTYQNRDFYLSAYLICKGCELLGTNRESGATNFTFLNTKDLQKHVDDFYKMRGIIDALSYAGAVRNLKSIIHQNKTAYLISTSDSEEINNGFNHKQQGEL